VVKILALDLGSRTGWARRDHGGPIAYGVWDCRPKSHQSAGFRLVQFKANFLQLARWNQHRGRLLDPPDLVVYELVMRHGRKGGIRTGTSAAHVYGALQGSLLELCETLQLACQGLGVSELKKHATGRGNASKAHMRAPALALIREANGPAALKLATDNLGEDAADAICLLDFARCRYSGPPPVTPQASEGATCP
jgi:hypothetical protein